MPQVSRRDLPGVVAKGADGATTVACTMLLAHRAGVRVFVTGGIGGVHRGGEAVGPFCLQSKGCELGVSRESITIVQYH